VAVGPGPRHPDGVLYRALADAVMLVHFGFLVFLVFGGFVAWRFRWVSVPHAAAVAWAVLILAGAQCPLTGWENALRRLGGEHGTGRGFIDTYLTGVVYPPEHLPAVQLLVGGLVAMSWLGLAVRHARVPRPCGARTGREGWPR
jgi:uncharacterized protein DUF2784